MMDHRRPEGLAAFRGVWRLERDIREASGAVARFAGEAEFTPDGSALRYQETGILHLPGAAPMRASRRYFWSELGSRIAVAFEDGRPFHDFDPHAVAAEAEHLCGADLYRVRYNFGGWPDWTAEWRVAGPRKDYSMLSRYGRS